jgi:uridine phosphorylase
MARLLGHKAVTVCLVIANRVAKRSNTAYKGGMRELVPHVLDRL